MKKQEKAKETMETENMNNVRCGGLMWRQNKVNNDENIWFLTCGGNSDSIVADSVDFLMPNKCLANLLKINSKKLTKLAGSINSEDSIYFDDCPTAFATFPEFTTLHRTRQRLWTLKGIENIFNILKAAKHEISEEIESWLIANKAKLYVSDAASKESSASTGCCVESGSQELMPLQIPSPTVETYVNELTSSEVGKAVNYITQILNYLRKIEIQNVSLSKQVRELKDAIAKNSTKQSSNSATVLNINCKIPTDLNDPDSLSKFLSRLPKAADADMLTRNGLLNSDQIYSAFAEKWNDPNTGKLIKKEDFQAILRYVFHKSNSSHRIPVLKANALRDNFAAVCTIRCKKKANPRDASGNILDIDNPAYTSNEHPCVRLQARYTSKAVELLIQRWEKYVSIFT